VKELAEPALWPRKSIYGPCLLKIFIFLESLQPEPMDAPLVCTATFSLRVSVRDGTKQLWEVQAGQPVAWAHRLRR